MHHQLVDNTCWFFPPIFVFSILNAFHWQANELNWMTSAAAPTNSVSSSRKQQAGKLPLAFTRFHCHQWAFCSIKSRFSEKPKNRSIRKLLNELCRISNGKHLYFARKLWINPEIKAQYVNYSTSFVKANLCAELWWELIEERQSYNGLRTWVC